MLGYVTMGTNDLERARGFYSGLLGTIGASELMRMSDTEANGFTLYGLGWGQPGIAVTRPYDGAPADRRCDGFDRRKAPPGDDDEGTGLGEGLGDGASDAGAAARHDGGAALKGLGHVGTVSVS